MPFCPICKAEYQEGFTVCADCKVELVDDIEEVKEAEQLIPFFQADDKKVAEKLVKFFNYSDVNSSLGYDKETDVYIVSISPKKQLEAKKLYQAFYFVERERMANGESDLFAFNDADQDATDEADMEAADESGESTDEAMEDSEEAFEGSEESFDHSLEKEAAEAEDEEYKGETPSDEVTAFDDEEDDSAPYVMKADQYKDLTGTVGVFLFFGIAGLIVVVLNVIGIINIFSGWIPNTVMTALFLFFIYVALSTNKKAKKIQAEIDEENAMTEKINEWLKKNITEEFLASIHNENISDELNYIKKTDTIKEMLIKEFGNLNLSYLDRLIEEFYYDTFDNQ